MSAETGVMAPTQRRGIPLAWQLLIVFDIVAVAFTYAQQATGSVPGQSDSIEIFEQLVVETKIDGDQKTQPGTVRFEAIDVFVDAGEISLAAYQLELSSQDDGVDIVGIEGGEHAAFSEPPYYDAKAMNNNRVILAAFNTGETLPTGRSRVARVHVQVDGPQQRIWQTTLMAAAAADGKRIPAEVSIAKAERRR